MQRFKCAKWGVFFLLFLCIGELFWFTLCLHPEDAMIYHELMKGERERAATKKVFMARPAYQLREGVQKDIWTVSDGQRLHFSLKSAHSLLTVVQKKKSFEATEELEGIDCWMQEGIDLEAGFQKVRHLMSEKGTYFFPAHRFETERVQLFFFRLPGHELPSREPLGEIPYLTGVASQASFAAARNLPTFTAYHLRAHFTQPEEGVDP